MTYILQRSIRDEVGKQAWFDAESFDDKKRARAALKFAKADETYRVNSDGGSGYTGRRAQPIRLIEVMA